MNPSYSHSPSADPITYSIPDGALTSPDFSMSVNGRPALIGATGVAAFATMAFSDAVEIVITVKSPIAEAQIRPLSRQVFSHIEKNSITIRLQKPGHFSIEIDELPPLFLYANSLETSRPDPNDDSVHFFEAGKVHDVGRLEIQSRETVYIEGGAILRGMITAADADHVTVRGHGILDGGALQASTATRHTLLFENCRHVVVEGIVMIHPTMWMLVAALCDDVVISNVKQIGEVVSSDGIDVVGSQNVLIEGCFLRNNDDCIVIKATNVKGRPNARYSQWGRDVRNIEVRDCVLLNAQAGNAMEIGFETQTESISNIRFHDIDVIGAHGEGGVFTIHNGDRARISDVVWEDIRVEHFYDKLIDFRILSSRWSQDEERGQIRDIKLRNIRTIGDVYNTPSLIGGYDEEHTITGIEIENFWIGAQPVQNPDDLHLFVKHASDIRFTHNLKLRAE